MRKKLKKTVYICLTLLFVSIVGMGEAPAANLYAQGIEHYKAGQTQQAKRIFLHIVKHKPDHWQSLYIVGNIYLSEKNYKQARKYYFSCVENYPDVPTCKKIQKAIAHIDQEELRISENPNPPPSVSETESEDIPVADVESETDDDIKLALANKIKKEAEERHARQVKAIESKKQKILSEANIRAQAIMDEAQKRVDHLRSNSNEWVRNVRTNEVHLGLATVDADRILNEARARANAIREEAQIRAQGFHLPKAPVHAQAIAEQLMNKPGPSGTQLNPVGTNAHVRNYIHNPVKKQEPSRKVAASDTHQN